MNRVKELKVWQKSVDLAVSMYEVTKNFPSEEKFGLISQITRSGVSIPSNIAEGAGRASTKEFTNFLSIANGSSFELETQLIIANRLKFISDVKFNELTGNVDEIQKMIYSLQRNLKKQISN